MSMSQLLFSFNGRISRSTFWLKFSLPVIIISLLIYIPMMAMMGQTQAEGGQPPAAAGILGIIYLIWSLLIIYPSLAVQAKRWHDRDKSAWWILINFIPIIGGIWALIECGILKGTDGPNRFGDDPLGEA